MASLLTAMLQSVTVQHHNGGHPAGKAFGGFCHCFATECGQFDRRFGIKHTGTFERRVFSKRKPGGVLRHNPRFAQNLRHAGRKGNHAGLRVLGLVDNTVRVLKAYRLQIKVKTLGNFIEYAAEGGELVIQIRAHPGVLTALTGI